MKKTIATVLALASLNSFAATEASLVLKGLVAPIYDISIVMDAAASTLNLGQSATGVKVGTLTEFTNHPQGYKVKAASKNAGKLVNQSDVASYVQYSLTYNGNAMSLSTSPVQISSTNTKGTYTKDLRISFNQPTNLSAGSYEDTVQFTIEAN